MDSHSAKDFKGHLRGAIRTAGKWNLLSGNDSLGQMTH